MSRIAIIPARGGSKRIPRKNTKDFCGKPIIAYSIEAALAADLFDEVMVSTDDPQIAEVAREYGASVPFLRSPENSHDFATTADVLREVHGAYDRSFTEACCIYATAPFVSAELLQRAHRLFSDRAMTSVFPVQRFGFPIQRALRREEDGSIKMFDASYQSVRSQDLPPAYHDCGMFYWYKPAHIVGGNSLYDGKPGTVIVNEMAAHDIDTPEDWRIAEFKYRILHE